MKVLPFIVRSIQPIKYYLLGPIGLIVVIGIDASLKPYLLKLMINALTLNVDDAMNKLWVIAPYYVFLQFLLPMAWRVYDWCNLKYEPALRNHIAKTAFVYISQHSYLFFQNNFAGNIFAKISDLTGHIPTIILTIINSYLANIVTVVIATILLWHVHPIFAVIIVIWVSFLVIATMLTIPKASRLARETAEAGSKIMSNMVDTITNMLSMRLFVANNYEIKRLDTFQNNYLHAAQKRRRYLLGCYSIQGFSFSICQSICLYILIHLYSQGNVTPGDFALILSLNMKIMDGLWQMSDQMRSFNEQWGAVDQALRMLYAPHEIIDAPQAKEAKITAGKIQFQKVYFQYKNAQPLFENLTVTINPGEKIGLVGYSGGGKSTFVNLVLRLFDVNSGKILIDGQDIREVTQDSLRRAIALIPQDPLLFHRTLMENIQYGFQLSSTEAVYEAARRAGADPFIQQLPTKYDSLVGERGIKLSGGQRQRIAISRAVLKDAPILILDEATSHLDSVTELQIQAALWELMQGKTTIIIAHRLSTLLRMDRILVFNQGTIVEDGTHKELIAKKGLYKTLWDTQIGGFIFDHVVESLE
jgi:ATP-binding cassette subfamily B protein